MNPFAKIFVVTLLCCLPAWAAESLPLENPGFENGLTGWSLWQDHGMSQAVSEAAHTGQRGLRVTDTSTTADGCNISSPRFPALAGKIYDLKGWVRTISGPGGGIFLKFWDANNQELPGGLAVSHAPTWTQLEVKAIAPPTATQVGIWIHTANHFVTTVDFDDLGVTTLSSAEVAASSAAAHAAGVSALAAAAQLPGATSAQKLLGQLRPEHPRLMLTREKIGQIKAELASDAQMKAWYALVHAEGRKILTEPPTTYADFAHNRRQVEDRVRTLGFLYLLEGDRAYADRAWAELAAASHWPDWHLPVGLDTGEMTLAFALGYDWFYEAWTPEQRLALREAIIDRGLNPAIANPWWKSVHMNWNAVINGGMGNGALAIADDDPEVATKALNIVLTTIRPAMEAYAPDGGWEEGYNYWDYATTFTAYLIDSLQTATGSDDGLSKYPGFSQTGFFPIELTGPLDQAFNFSDSPNGAGDSSALFWLAREFQIPYYAQFEKKYAHPTVMNLVWYSPKLIAEPVVYPPKRIYFRSVQVVCLRTAWNDPKATFVGFKGGFPRANHRHLDEGSFVFDVSGRRFAWMAGAENYGMPGYFDEKKERWTYYRARAEGANTLVFNPDEGPDQEPDAAAPMTKVNLAGDRPFAIVDLSQTYARNASAVHRGLALIDGKQLLIQDEIQTRQPAEVWWLMHTLAQADATSISPDGRSVILTKIHPGETVPILVKAEILSPADATFQIRPATPLPKTVPAPADAENPELNAQRIAARQPFQNLAPADSPNPGVNVLAIDLKNVGAATVAVTLTPVASRDESPAQPKVVPLASW